jgi:hypothetical protein
LTEQKSPDLRSDLRGLQAGQFTGHPEPTRCAPLMIFEESTSVQKSQD